MHAARRKEFKQTYTFDGLTDKFNSMENQFFPALIPAIVLFEAAMLDLLLVSSEYKHILLTVGNAWSRAPFYGVFPPQPLLHLELDFSLINDGLYYLDSR